MFRSMRFPLHEQNYAKKVTKYNNTKNITQKQTTPGRAQGNSAFMRTNIRETRQTSKEKKSARLVVAEKK